MRRAIEKSNVVTKQFLSKCFDKTSSSLVQTSDGESVSPERSTVSRPPTNVMATEKIEKQAENKQKSETKIILRKFPNKCPNLAHQKLDCEGFSINLLLKCNKK